MKMLDFNYFAFNDNNKKVVDSPSYYTSSTTILLGNCNDNSKDNGVEPRDWKTGNPQSRNNSIRSILNLILFTHQIVFVSFLLQFLVLNYVIFKEAGGAGFTTSLYFAVPQKSKIFWEIVAMIELYQLGRLWLLSHLFLRRRTSRPVEQKQGGFIFFLCLCYTFE